MDVYQILGRDHQTVQQIFFEINKTNVSETERREQLFRTLHNELEAHEVLEESVLYPQIDKYPETAELVGLAFEEHAEVDAILQEISELPADKPEWLERIAELKDLVHNTYIAKRTSCSPPPASYLTSVAPRTSVGKLPN